MKSLLLCASLFLFVAAGLVACGGGTNADRPAGDTQTEDVRPPVKGVSPAGEGQMEKVDSMGTTVPSDASQRPPRHRAPNQDYIDSVKANTKKK